MTDLQLPVYYNLIPHVKSDKVFIKSVLELRNPYGWRLLWFPKHEVTRGVTTPPWMGCQSIARLPPPSISSGFTENLLVPFILLGERCTVKVAELFHIFSPYLDQTRKTFLNFYKELWLKNFGNKPGLNCSAVILVIPIPIPSINANRTAPNAADLRAAEGPPKDRTRT